MFFRMMAEDPEGYLNLLVTMLGIGYCIFGIILVHLMGRDLPK